MHIKADNKNREGEEERLRFGSQRPAGIPRREMEGGAEASSPSHPGEEKKAGQKSPFRTQTGRSSSFEAGPRGGTGGERK